VTLALSILLAGLWLVLAGAFACVGALVLGDRGGLEEGWPAAHAAFWIGVGSVTCALLAWHLVLPVNGLALGALGAVALAGGVRHHRLFTSCLKTERWWPKPVFAAGFAVWVADHALAAGAMDDYLYEFQAIRWDHDFRIVPGLANLHGRLGFNESHHLLAAMLSVGPLAGNVNHVINGLFVTVLVAYLAGGLQQLVRPGAAARGSSVLRAMLLGPAVGLTLFGSYGSMISTLKADLLVTCCVLLLSCLLVELAEAEWGTAQFNRTATVLIVVSAFAVSVKLSAVVFCLVLGAGVCGRLALGAHGWRRPIDRVIWSGLALSVVTVSLVPLRGVVVSGYPAYPATVLSANVDWKVPEAAADAERALITSWARQHPTYNPRELQGRGWIGNWARVTVMSEKFTVVLPLALTLMCLAAAVVRGGALRHGSSPAPPSLTPAWSYATVLAACGAALCVWWLAAPAGRFAVGYFWSIAATSLAWTLERRVWSSWLGVTATGLAGAGVLALVFALVGFSPGYRGLFGLVILASGWMIACAIVGHKGGAPLAALLVALALAQPADRLISFLSHGQFADGLALVWLVPDFQEDSGLPGYPAVARQTRSGLTVYVTQSTRFETPIPNTRYFNPYLELRARSLSSGFRTRLPPDLEGVGYSLDFRRSGRPVPDR
jgi:hypothetical protein